MCASCSLLFKPNAAGAEVCIPSGQSPWREEHSGRAGLKGGRQERDIYQDILYAGVGARSFESLHEIDCTLTTPKLMLSRGLFSGVPWEESWHFYSCPARKSIFTEDIKQEVRQPVSWDKAWIPWSHLERTQVIIVMANILPGVCYTPGTAPSMVCPLPRGLPRRWVKMASRFDG